MLLIAFAILYIYLYIYLKQNPLEKNNRSSLRGEKVELCGEVLISNVHICWRFQDEAKVPSELLQQLPDLCVFTICHSMHQFLSCMYVEQRVIL